MSRSSVSWFACFIASKIKVKKKKYYFADYFSESWEDTWFPWGILGFHRRFFVFLRAIWMWLAGWPEEGTYFKCNLVQLHNPLPTVWKIRKHWKLESIFVGLYKTYLMAKRDLNKLESISGVTRTLNRTIHTYWRTHVNIRLWELPPPPTGNVMK